MKDANRKRYSIVTMRLGPSIDAATLTHVRNVLVPVLGTPQTDLPLHSPAAQALSIAFHRWNPTKLLDIKEQDKLTIDCIFSIESSDCSTNLIIARLQDKITSIVVTWLTSFKQNTGTVSKDEMQQLLLILQADTWKTYQIFTLRKQRTELCFPTIEELQLKIDQVGKLQTLIQQYTTIQIHGQLYTLKELCSKYKIYNLEDVLNDRNLQQQLERLRVIFGSNSDILYHWAYFSSYPSLLLGDTYQYFCQNGGYISGVATRILENKKRILNVFGPSMNYTSVANALQVLNTNDLINKEITTILNCEVLQITARDITDFRALQLLHELEKPLQEFIATCTNYKFYVALDDVSFTTLKEEVQSFYSAECDKHRRVCLSFVDRLFNLLCPPPQSINEDNVAIKVPYVSLLYKIHKLKEVLIKVLHPVSCTSHGPNLWTFFHDMNWFSDNIDEINGEGLQRYYEQNDITVSILNEYDATNELLIVDTLTPVVRFFNYVQHNVFSPSLHQLISNLLQDKDMDNFLLQTTITTIDKSVHELNSRIVSIKDLFQSIDGSKTANTSTATSTIYEHTPSTRAIGGTSSANLPTNRFVFGSSLHATSGGFTLNSSSPACLPTSSLSSGRFVFGSLSPAANIDTGTLPGDGTPSNAGSTSSRRRTIRARRPR